MMNYLAAELTRYLLEISFLSEAELWGTNPIVIKGRYTTRPGRISSVANFFYKHLMPPASNRIH